MSNRGCFRGRAQCDLTFHPGVHATIEFPIRSLMDEQACHNGLLEVLHTEGLYCPQGHALPADQAPHGRHRAPIVDYHYRTCRAGFNILTHTVWSRSRYGGATIVLILRGIAPGAPTAVPPFTF